MKNLLLVVLAFVLLFPTWAFINSGNVNDVSANEPCAITFKNYYWNYLTIQVCDRGNRANCDGNPIIQTFSLEKGDEFTLYAYGDICYRSKAPGMLWSYYSTVDCYSWGGEKTVSVTSGGFTPRN